jgi:putative ABC transport system permease protein
MSRPTAEGRLVSRIVRHYLHYDADNPFISISALLAFLGIMIGVMVLMIAMGIMNGTQKEFAKRLFVMNYPMTILPLDPLALDDQLIESIRERFPQIQISPYYATQVIAKHAGSVQGMLLYGVDFERERAINSVFAQSQGDQQTPFKLVTGDAFAVMMNAYKHDKLTLYFSEQQAIGLGTMPLQKRFVIDAIFDSGLQAYDKAIGYTTLEALEKLLKRPHGIYDGLHLHAQNPMDIIEELRDALPDNLIIEGWWQQNGGFFAAMQMEKKALFLVLLLIILVASLNIISSLLMTVMSRRPEIALLRTLGATQKQIQSIFFRLGLIIGSSGMIAGILLGTIGIWILKTFDIISLPPDVYGTSKLPVDLLPGDLVLILIGTALIILLSSLYPAKKAAQTDPLTVLRNT